MRILNLFECSNRRVRKMKIQIKTILILGVASMLLFGLIYFYLKGTMLESYNALEEQKVKENVLRIKDRLYSDFESADKTTLDWSNWDDMYEFAEGTNPDFPRRNIDPTTFSNVQMDVIIVLNNSLSVMFAQRVDQHTHIESPVPKDLMDQLVPGKALAQKDNDGDGVDNDGILVLNDGIFVTAIESIRRTGGKGSSSGYLIMGRFIDEQSLNEFEKELKYPIELYPMNGTSEDAFDNVAIEKIAKNTSLLFSILRNETQISAYTGVDDIYGKPAILIETMQDRDIFLFGKSAFTSFIQILLVGGFLTLFFTMLLLDRLVLFRVKRLSEKVIEIGRGRKFGQRLEVGEKDEVSDVSQSINIMLDRLSASQKEMADAKEKLDLAINSAEIVTWDWVVGKDFITWSDNFGIVHPGYSKEDYPSFASYRRIVAPEGRDELSRSVSTQLANSDVFATEHCIILPDGSRKWLNSRGKIFRKDGKPERVSGTIMDITGRKKAEKVLEDSIAEMKRLDQTKSEFLNMVSHELKTPITAISAHLDVIDDMKANLAPQELKSLEAIRRNKEQLRMLIENILEISRMESGRFQLNYVDVDVGKIIEEIAVELRVVAQEKGIQLLYDVENIPLIDADDIRVKEIVVNLTTNAIKFTEKGSVKIKAEQKGEFVEISVIDTGVGIPRDKIPNLFQKFYQVDASLDRKYGGSGLGLAIVKMLVEAHGGKVDVNSVLGKGTVFTVTLPTKKPEKEVGAK